MLSSSFERGAEMIEKIPIVKEAPIRRNYKKTNDVIWC